MRIFFVNRFYWPAEPATAQLLTDLSEALAARRWAVTVITGNVDPSLPQRERRHGVDIVRVGAPMGRSQNLMRRAWDFFGFHAAVLPALRRELHTGDIVVALTDPPLVGLTAARIAAARGAHLVNWVQDIYPEVVAAVKPTFATRLLVSLFRPWRDRAWRKSAANITLGPGMASLLTAAGVENGKIHLIANWAPRGVAVPPPETVHALRAEWEIANRFVIGYSGNLGRVHDLGGLLDVAAQLQADTRFLFLFIGGGAEFSALQAASQRRRLENVRFLPPQPRRILSASLAAADVHIISLRQGCERVVFPSKLYGIAAVGRPVLFLGPPQSDIARAIADIGMGGVFAPRHAAGIAAFLRELASSVSQQRQCSDAALRFHAANGGSERAADQWDALLRTIAGAAAPDMVTAPLTSSPS